MILYDPSVIVNYRDYGIMLPIPSDRGKRILEYLNKEKSGDKFNVYDFASANAFLVREGKAISREDLERVHSKEFIAQLYGGGLDAALLNTFELIDKYGKPNRYEPDRAIRPLSELFETITAQAGGTYLACLLALSGGDLPKRRFCYYLGGGMHHARHDAGSGFCLINDVAAAAFKILAEKNFRLVWIIDMDAHKGDGTAELVRFARKRGELQNPGGESGKSILTLSIHMAKGWPLDRESVEAAEQERAPLLPSDVDIGIEEGEEESYLVKLEKGIWELENLSGRKPDFALVVDGADPYEHDGLPSSSLMRLTMEQCFERDAYVYRYLQRNEIPSAWIQSGGYGERAWEPPAYFLKSVI